ncbi:hypothetical protein KKC32_04505 [Patescibacteria group bacterium]|nr:hypothetical protein [Patescibacteria group bacterium]
MYIRSNHPGVSEGYKKMILGFVVITVLLVVIIFYFSASKAVIEVTPRVTKLETEFVADVEADGGGGSGSLQAKLMETEVDGSLEETATGSKGLSGNSIGKVIVYNKRGDSQALVKTTRLLDPNGVLLRLTDRVDIPANGQVEADVYADDPTSFEELPATNFIIPGLSQSMQSLVYAESQSVLKSTGVSVSVIKAADIARAKEKLEEDLKAKALEDFNLQVSGKNYAVIIVAKEVVSENVSDPVESVKDKFTVEMKLKISAIALDQEKILELAGSRLQSIVPDGQQLLSLNMNNFSYNVQNYNVDTKTANVRVHVEGENIIKEDNAIFDKEKIAGLSTKGVELYLANFDSVESVKISLSPFWVKRIPSLKDHIVITIVRPSK